MSPKTSFFLIVGKVFVKSSSQPADDRELYWTKQVTSSPLLINLSTRCEPKKPSLPVTKIFNPSPLESRVEAP